MSDSHETCPEVDLAYMVTSVDESGDTHIFVPNDLHRAVSRRREVIEQLTDVMANWLDR